MRFIAILMALALAGCTTPPDETIDQTEGMYDADSYTLTATNVPESATAGEAFTFNLTIAGPDGTSDHIGGHFWNHTVAEPDTGSAEHKATRQSCQHDASALPGEYLVMCTMSDEGTNTLYGHLAVTEGETTYNYWTAAFTVDVTAAVAV